MEWSWRRSALILAFVAALAACAPPAQPEARRPPPPPPGAPPQGKAEFAARCAFSHRLADDPIVKPNQPGASHSHDFFGSRATNASTTATAQLGTTTTCDVRADKSAYWVPTLYVNGSAVRPDRATFYYTSDHKDPRTIVAFPAGFKMIAGTATAQSELPGPRPYTWSCQGVGGSGSASFPTCPVDHPLELLLHFPSCWDGTSLDSADHKSHVASPIAGQCPPSHPVAIPRVEIKLRYPTLGGPTTQLASGTSFSAHGDFFNNWDPPALQQRINDCLHRAVKCP